MRNAEYLSLCLFGIEEKIIRYLIHGLAHVALNVFACDDPVCVACFMDLHRPSFGYILG